MGHGGYVIRIKYGKLGAGKYISHLDTIRAAERALRRLGLTLLYSEGFNPRPRMSFAAALQVGVQSTAEHMDVFLIKPADPKAVVEVGERAFPEAMPIIAAGAFDGSYTLPSKVVRAVYSVKPYGQACNWWTEGALNDAVGAMLDLKSIEVPGRDGKQKEIKELIYEVKALPGGLVVDLACGNRNLRPSEFMAALAAVSGADYGQSQDICRIGLKLGLGDAICDPLDGCTGNFYSEKFRS